MDADAPSGPGRQPDETEPQVPVGELPEATGAAAAERHETASGSAAPDSETNAAPEDACERPAAATEGLDPADSPSAEGATGGQADGAQGDIADIPANGSADGAAGGPVEGPAADTGGNTEEPPSADASHGTVDAAALEQIQERIAGLGSPALISVEAGSSVASMAAYAIAAELVEPGPAVGDAEGASVPDDGGGTHGGATATLPAIAAGPGPNVGTQAGTATSIGPEPRPPVPPSPAPRSPRLSPPDRAPAAAAAAMDGPRRLTSSTPPVEFEGPSPAGYAVGAFLAGAVFALAFGALPLVALRILSAPSPAAVIGLFCAYGAVWFGGVALVLVACGVVRPAAVIVGAITGALALCGGTSVLVYVLGRLNIPLQAQGIVTWLGVTALLLSPVAIVIGGLATGRRNLGAALFKLVLVSAAAVPFALLPMRVSGLGLLSVRLDIAWYLGTGFLALQAVVLVLWTSKPRRRAVVAGNELHAAEPSAVPVFAGIIAVMTLLVVGGARYAVINNPATTTDALSSLQTTTTTAYSSYSSGGYPTGGHLSGGGSGTGSSGYSSGYSGGSQSTGGSSTSGYSSGSSSGSTAGSSSGSTSSGGFKTSDPSQAYWSVSVFSFKDRANAEAQYRDLAAKGYDVMLDWSSDYPLLQPGWWVVHIGHFALDDERGAWQYQSTLGDALARPEDDRPFRECFGPSPPCRPNNYDVAK